MSFLVGAGLFGETLLFYTARAQQQAAAAAAVQNGALGAAAGAIAAQDLQQDNLGNDTRSFVLELIPAASTTSSGTPSSTGGAGTGAVQTITLDTYIGPNVAGHAQTISYSFTARQSTKDSAKGFYVEEFGEGVGSLSIDCLVCFNASPISQVTAWFNLLHTAKLSNPLSGAQPYRLRFTDTFLGRTFMITQKDVTLSQTVEELNRGRFRVTADILQDYSNPAASQQNTSLSSSQLGDAQSVATASLNDLLSGLTSGNAQTLA